MMSTDLSCDLPFGRPTLMRTWAVGLIGGPSITTPLEITRGPNRTMWMQDMTNLW